MVVDRLLATDPDDLLHHAIVQWLVAIQVTRWSADEQWVLVCSRHLSQAARVVAWSEPPYSTILAYRGTEDEANWADVATSMLRTPAPGVTDIVAGASRLNIGDPVWHARRVEDVHSSASEEEIEEETEEQPPPPPKKSGSRKRKAELVVEEPSAEEPAESEAEPPAPEGTDVPSSSAGIAQAKPPAEQPSTYRAGPPGRPKPKRASKTVPVETRPAVAKKAPKATTITSHFTPAGARPGTGLRPPPPKGAAPPAAAEGDIEAANAEAAAAASEPAQPAGQAQLDQLLRQDSGLPQAAKPAAKPPAPPAAKPPAAPGASQATQDPPLFDE